MNRILPIICLSAAIAGGGCSAEDKPAAGAGERKPVLAGSYYPADPGELKREVDALLAAAPEVSVPGRLLAVVAPHAGYVYSGPTAAAAFKAVRGRKIATVVLVGCAHRVGFPGVSVPDFSSYRTPLGAVPVDSVLAERIRAAAPEIVSIPGVHRSEPTLEAEIPFIQTVLPDARIVPVLIGDAPPAALAALGTVLGDILRDDPETIAVCSTDLSHYPGVEDAARVDRQTLEAVAALDPSRLDLVRERFEGGNVPNLVCVMCGFRGVKAVVAAALRAGADGAAVIAYANSADSPAGNPDSVVGYGAVAIYDSERDRADNQEEQPMNTATDANLSPKARAELLKTAREALTAVVNGRPLPDSPIDDPELQGHRGAFVTLNENGALRGCIGQFTADEPLYRVVRTMAREAALHDPRFVPVSPAEADRIDIEISVLSPMRRISDPLREVVPGKHGIYIRRGARGGTYLPQVATEHHMGLEEFLSSCCAHKAGLAPDAWKDPETEVYVYTAEVFGEE
ncbi:MAG TPA: AmmeMemoRadiSam system protein B [bacterium]|nr:AmmeMemoRadiSam system protein B [bacterium]HPQ65689.1 AmmeMemoRadiSam system protein B [bacterium]